MESVHETKLGKKFEAIVKKDNQKMLEKDLNITIVMKQKKIKLIYLAL